MSRRIAVLGAVLAVSVAAGGIAAAAGSGSAGTRPVSLTITFWVDEQKPQELRRRTVTCNPIGGSLPTRKVACRRLAGMTAAVFAPVPRDAICTQLYGGPQKAVVKGRLGDQRIWSSFRRRNGCEIDRWQRFSPWLLPPGGGDL